MKEDESDFKAVDALVVEMFHFEPHEGSRGANRGSLESQHQSLEL